MLDAHVCGALHAHFIPFAVVINAIILETDPRDQMRNNVSGVVFW
ncbi:MAG: hypothetical protein VBE63_05330 [Lamprobacter sp.]|nr:hypothetical protein [Lamprobacter sp.]MEA3639349.1 hypothetical protein [Lamprobacter sp.]